MSLSQYASAVKLVLDGADGDDPELMRAEHSTTSAREKSQLIHSTPGFRGYNRPVIGQDVGLAGQPRHHLVVVAVGVRDSIGAITRDVTRMSAKLSKVMVFS